MSRQLRILLPGLTYHVRGRANGRMAMYRDDDDRRRFLDLLAQVVPAFALTSHAFCLMDDHYHLAITTRDANLPAAMHWLNGEYAQWWNRRHERIGHVLHGRYLAKVVQDDVYLLTVAKYIVRNPVRAKIVESPEQWPWSSYRASAGLAPVPSFLCPTFVWKLLGDGDGDTSVRRYREFIAMPGDDAERLRRMPIIGNPEFIARFDELRRRASREVPLRERDVRPTLDTLFADAVTRADRKARAVQAKAAGHTLVAIARYLGLHKSTVSKMTAGVVRGSG